MARCGHCGAKNLQTQPLSADGQALESHRVPWANSAMCKGLETYYNRPQAIALDRPTPMALLRDDNVHVVRPAGYIPTPTPTTQRKKNPLRIREAS